MTVGPTKTPSYMVKTQSGQVMEFPTETERRFFVACLRHYTDQNTFTHQSDLRTLERLVFLETLCLRYQNWISKGESYDGYLDERDIVGIQKQLKEATTIISVLQNDLGLTRNQRDKEQHDSVSGYINTLKLAAKEQGIHRDRQVGKAIELFNTLKSMVGAYRRSNEHERAKLGLETAEHVLDWIEQIAIPEYDRIDAHHRATNQKMWIRSL